MSEASSAEEGLDLLGRELATRHIPYALLQSTGDLRFRMERATLPLLAEVWGRDLALPKLAKVLASARPSTVDTSAFATDDGLLLTSDVPGTFLAAPAAGGTLLCLALPSAGEGERAAAWALAVQASRPPHGEQPTLPTEAGGTEEIDLFHNLTRRLSYILNDDAVVRAGIDALAQSIALGGAASVLCHSRVHSVVVFGETRRPDEAASQAIRAFLKLTGDAHASCETLPFDVIKIDRTTDAEDGRSFIDAPLIIEGQVEGLLQVAAASENGPLVYTVANQLSLALERSAVQRRAERAHIASLAESLTDGIVLVDAALRVTSMNNAATALLDPLLLTEGSDIGETPLAPIARQALTVGEATDTSELPAPSDGAARRYLVASAAPLAGSPEGSAAVVIVRDVTEERLMQERLLQSEKMVSVGQLVSGVAHELNNPLTGIMGFAQLLQANELDSRTLDGLQTIYSEAERASKIVQNLLSFARRKRADKELSDLNALLERVLELRNYDLTVKSIEVVRELDPKLPKTMVDPDQIQQVFLNLIINAEHSMISAHGKGTLTVRSLQKGDHLQVSLSDDGPGIEEATLRRIFDPFFTTKQAGEGTGLGLTISYGIIDEHGGRIWAESQPGRGTTFTIELPIVHGAGRTPDKPAAERETSVDGVSVLVVDDEESIRRLLTGILEMDGHRIDTAANGEEALDKIAGHSYDVVITDIKMPDMDGPSLYRRLVRLDPVLAAHTIFITGDTVNPDTRRFLDDVANPCLSKPFRVRQVRDTIAGILEE
jgi:signal transduction histidine kinase